MQAAHLRSLYDLCGAKPPNFSKKNERHVIYRPEKEVQKKQIRGIEPPFPAWEAGVLPMNHICMMTL